MQVILKESDFKNDALTPVGKWVIEFNLNDGVDTLKAGIQKGGESFWIEKRVHFVTKLSFTVKGEAMPRYAMTTAYGIAWRYYKDEASLIEHFNNPSDGKRYCRYATKEEIRLIHQWIEDRRS